MQVGGRPQGGGQFATAFVDDARITKGVARYPGGTTFDVPTEAFPTS